MFAVFFNAFSDLVRTFFFDPAPSGASGIADVVPYLREERRKQWD